LSKQTVRNFFDPGSSTDYFSAIFQAGNEFRNFLNNAQSEQQRQAIQMSSSAPDIQSIQGQQRGFENSFITQMLERSNQLRRSKWENSLTTLLKMSGQKPESITKTDAGNPVVDMFADIGTKVGGMALGSAFV
jgi:hypothetical protein